MNLAESAKETADVCPLCAKKPPPIAYVCLFVGILTTFVGLPMGVVWLALHWWRGG